MTIDDIRDRFQRNLHRVRGLVTSYESLVASGTNGASAEHTDVLRAAVVLLHATLEDLMRSLEELRLPTANEKSFERVKFPKLDTPYKEWKETFSLVDLATYRGRSVNEVYRAAINAHLERSNYGNVGELKAALKRIGMDRPLDRDLAASLESMMKRRHWIAHRADADPEAIPGQHNTLSIDQGSVIAWHDDVEHFGGMALNFITPEEEQ